MFTNTLKLGRANEANNINKNDNTIQENIISNTYDYKKYSTIKLLHADTGKVEELPLDEYLYGVVAAEMPATFEVEALKAQAVVARTYTLYKITTGSKYNGADVSTDSSVCQAWISKEDRLAKWSAKDRDADWAKIVNAVNSTAGEIITYDGKPIDAFFHANSGGKTETPANVWGGTGYPYLQVVETAGEDAYSQYESTVKLSYDDLLKKLKTKYPKVKIDFTKADDIKIIEDDDSGRVKTVKFGNIQIAGVEARTIFGLKSANFTMVKDEKEKQITFDVIGYGHGVGMSQTGADTLAKDGEKYDEIIKHFYIGVELENI